MELTLLLMSDYTTDAESTVKHIQYGSAIVLRTAGCEFCRLLSTGNHLLSPRLPSLVLLLACQPLVKKKTKIITYKDIKTMKSVEKCCIIISPFTIK